MVMDYWNWTRDLRIDWLIQWTYKCDALPLRPFLGLATWITNRKFMFAYIEAWWTNINLEFCMQYIYNGIDDKEHTHHLSMELECLNIWVRFIHIALVSSLKDRFMIGLSRKQVKQTAWTEPDMVLSTPPRLWYLWTLMLLLLEAWIW